jgi:hypothetical protein
MASETLEKVDRERMLRNAHAIAQPKRLRGIPLWSFVGDITSHGCGYSIRICRELGWDPDQPASEPLPQRKLLPQRKPETIPPEPTWHYGPNPFYQRFVFVLGRNGGQQCDTQNGPCACGAWHGLETNETKRKEQDGELQQGCPDGQPHPRP